MKGQKKIKRLRYNKFKTLRLLRLNFTYIKRFSKKKHFRKLKHTVGLLKILSKKFNLNNIIHKPTILFSNIVMNRYAGFYLNTNRFIKPTALTTEENPWRLTIPKLPKSILSGYLTDLKSLNVVGSKDIILFNNVKYNLAPTTLNKKKILYNLSYTYTNGLIRQVIQGLNLTPYNTLQKSKTYTTVKLTKLFFLF